MRIEISAAILAATLAGVFAPSLSTADEPRVGRVTNELTQEECSACHLAFQPGFLPQRSWVYIMDNLSDHYGEDASLGDAAVQEIKNYLVANAMDTSSRGTRFLRGIADNEIPLRISEFSWFAHEHGSRRIRQAESNPKIGSISNCTACHKGADRGYFDDD